MAHPTIDTLKFQPQANHLELLYNQWGVNSTCRLWSVHFSMCWIATWTSWCNRDHTIYMAKKKQEETCFYRWHTSVCKNSSLQQDEVVHEGVIYFWKNSLQGDTEVLEAEEIKQGKLIFRRVEMTDGQDETRIIVWQSDWVVLLLAYFVSFFGCL